MVNKVMILIKKERTSLAFQAVEIQTVDLIGPGAQGGSVNPTDEDTLLNLPPEFLSAIQRIW